MVKDNLYELTTSETFLEPPLIVRGKNLKTVRRSITRKLHKGEKILELKRNYFPKKLIKRRR